MKQETYYVVVNAEGWYICTVLNEEMDCYYTGDLALAALFDKETAEFTAEEYNGTVKEVTITIKD